MGTYYYYSNDTKKEWFSSGALGDNEKFPVNQGAVGLYLLLLDGHWQGDKITIRGDGGDLPWEEDVDGHEAWTNITNRVKQLLIGRAAYGYWNGPDGECVAIRVSNELTGMHAELLKRCMDAIKATVKVDPDEYPHL